MKIGIIGPPQTGKTTLFRILLQQASSGTVGIVKTHDHRIDKISELLLSKKTSYPEFAFLDIGLISGFNKQDLSRLQDIDLFICVIGTFFAQDIKKDFDGCLTDIIISDLEAVQNRISRIQKEGKKSDSGRELNLLERTQAFLSDGRLLWKAGFNADDVKIIAGLILLSLKPLVVAVNLSEEGSGDSEDRVKDFEEYCRAKGISCIKFFGKTESELIELEPEERKKFIQEIGPGYNFKEGLCKLILRELGLITFFTTGEKETRGWYLKSGLSVIEAAGKIHSDMKKGFIRAEVVNFEDFVKHGSMHKAREAGLLKVEGKEYIVKDGDIINVRFNV